MKKQRYLYIFSSKLGKQALLTLWKHADKKLPTIGQLLFYGLLVLESYCNSCLIGLHKTDLLPLLDGKTPIGFVR